MSKHAPTIAKSAWLWIGVGLFWLAVTRNFHPTWTLAIVVTTTLMLAYAVAAYLNHLYLIPTYLRSGKSITYLALLVSAMLVLTAVALAVIRVSYLYIFGPYPVNDWYIDYALDLFGMAVHLVLAMLVVAALNRLASADSQ